MPLEKGSSREVISRNIAELVKAGHKSSQAAAIAYKEAGEAKDGEPRQGAGVVFVGPDGHVLLLLRSAAEENWAHHWALPGGKADEGETPEEAAKREAREELGNAPEGELHLIDRRITPTGMIYSTFVQPVDSAFVPTLNEEHCGYAWAPLDKLPTPIHPAVKSVLERLAGEGELESANDGDHETDAYGRVHLERVPITKATVNEYKGSEIPGWRELGLEADRLYKLLRDPDEIAKAAPTANGIQLLIKHVPVSADDHKPYDVAGSIGTRAEFDKPYLYNDVSVWTQFAIDGIDDETRRELSSSYGYRPDMTPGEYEGQPYDGVMRDLKFNHVALVIKGRAGPDVAIDEALSEATLKKESPVSKKTVVASRTAIRLQAAVSALAMDAAANMGNLFVALNKTVTAKTFTESKPKIAKAIRVAFDAEGGAVGATPDDVIMKVLDMVEGQTKAEPMEADEAQPAAAGATESNGGAPAAGGGQMDKAKLMDWLKAKGMGEDDMAELDGMYGDPAEDEETEEEKAARMAQAAKDRKTAKDKEPCMVSKEAMDQALAATEQRVLQTGREITAAFAYVRPWVGDLANDESITSASDVYRKALTSLRVPNAVNLHADALRPVLEAQPKPNASKRPAPAPLANDAAGRKSFDERFPQLSHIHGG